MKIGILTFHLPTNFGANLQAFASSRYFASLGHDVVVLNYARQEDLDNSRKASDLQLSAHRDFVNNRLPLTRQVTTPEELANIVAEMRLELIVVGADAVWRVPKDDDVYFCKWLFSDKRISNVPVASMSVAHMGNGFSKLAEEHRNSIAECLRKFTFLTVRDDWTSTVVNRDLFNGEEVVNTINPDPVFTLNLDAEEWDSKGIKSRGYYVMTLPLKWSAGHKRGLLRKVWFSAFKRAVNKAGYKLVELPLPEGVSGMKFDFTVPYPIDPAQWFLWIKNAKGFIGLRFHAVVSSFANGTPFFSLDSYSSGGAERSKIHNLLKGTQFESFRVDELITVNPGKLFHKMKSVSRESVLEERDKKRAVFELNMSRMLATVEGRSKGIEDLRDSCTGCFACANACPAKAIAMPENDEGFYYPRVNYQQCINCGLCEKICPVLAPSIKRQMQKAYYGYNLTEKERKTSSSGGVFSVLASKVMQAGGIVYGSSFSYSPLLRLECHSTGEVSLEELKRSKYVQSYIGDAYSRVKADLDKGLEVLFCGTPCQADGLKSYLRKDYPNLITVDFVCHGVPPAAMLREHIDMLKLKDIKLINFRPKHKSWVDDIEIEYGKGQKYTNYWRNDEYFCSFEKARSIRRSCYNCRYCNGERAADITLADFWGYKNYDPSIYDVRGLSLILANSDKGASFLDGLKEIGCCKMVEIDTKYADYAYARVRSGNQNGYNLDVRNEFFSLVKQYGYQKALEKKGWFFAKRDRNRITYNVKNKIKSLLSR